MTAFQKARRKEACSFSIGDIETLLEQMSDKKKFILYVPGHR